MRGVLAGVLTLIALQVLGSGNGPAAGGAFAVWLSKGLEKALSPEVAAIPTAKKAPPAKSSSSSGSTGGIALPRNPSVSTVNV